MTFAFLFLTQTCALFWQKSADFGRVLGLNYAFISKRCVMRFAVFCLIFFLSSCGFQLRGAELSALPYKSLHIALKPESELYLWLSRYIQSLKSTVIVEDSAQAEATFMELNNIRQKNILSLDAQGRVKEYRLAVDYTFQVVNQKGEIIVPPNEINLTRDVSHSDDNLLAKESEEAILWRDMYQDLSNQILRRLAMTQPQAVVE